MAAFMFRCPTMQTQVQGWFAGEPFKQDSDDDSYVAVLCIACRQSHLVNPATGKVLGSDDGV